MSDIYDYAYGHILRYQDEDRSYENAIEETSSHLAITEVLYKNATSSDESNSESEVNTDDFSPRDLQIFVDCLEAIARLEQTRSKRKVTKYQNAEKKIQVTCLDSSDCKSLDEDDAKSSSDYSFTSEDYLYSDTYFEQPNQGQSTAIYSNIIYNRLMSTTVPLTSDSEDSGIFVNNTDEGHIYESIEPLRAKTKIVSYSKKKTLKSRLISIFLKKQHKKNQQPTLEILTSTTIGEQNEDASAKEAKKKKNKKSSGKKSAEKFLSKAIRLLNL